MKRTSSPSRRPAPDAKPSVSSILEREAHDFTEAVRTILMETHSAYGAGKTREEMLGTIRHAMESMASTQEIKPESPRLPRAHLAACIEYLALGAPRSVYEDMTGDEIETLAKRMGVKPPKQSDDDDFDEDAEWDRFQARLRAQALTLMLSALGY